MYDIIAFAHLYKPHLGGLEKYVENFYKHLPNKKVLVVTSKYFKDLPTEEKDGTLDIFRIDSIEIVKGKYFVPSLKGIREIKNIIDSNQKAEIHTHTRFYFTYCIALFFAKKYKLLHYHFDHSSSFVKDGSFLVRVLAYIFDHTFSKYVLNNAKYTFPISESVKMFLKSTFKNIEYGPTLYNSYDFKNESFSKKKKPEILKLLFVGRIIRTKGVYELVKACKRLKESNFKFKLTMIGDGSEILEIKKLIKEYKLEEEVELKGALAYEDTQLLYPMYDLFINPSYTEGLPTTVLEALGNNLFVVATDAGGTREILPKEDLIHLDTLSGEVIKDRVFEIYENWDNEYVKYKNFYSSVKERFNWESNTNKFIEFISNRKENEQI